MIFAEAAWNWYKINLLWMSQQQFDYGYLNFDCGNVPSLIHNIPGQRFNVALGFVRGQEKCIIFIILAWSVWKTKNANGYSSYELKINTRFDSGTMPFSRAYRVVDIFQYNFEVLC